MSYTIRACKQEDTDLLMQFAALKLDKKEPLQSYMQRTCQMVFPGDKEAFGKVKSLMDKCLPLLSTYNKASKLSPRRVFDLMVVALQKKEEGDAPQYLKKGKSQRRTLIIDENKNEFYILLKSKGGQVEKSSKTSTRLTVAIRVPYAANQSAAVVYQLGHSDTGRRLSVAELSEREKRSISLCRNHLRVKEPKGYTRIQYPCPKIAAAYSFIKEKNGARIAKVTAFIESSDGILAGFNPSNDRHRTFGFSGYLPDFIHNNDSDSVLYSIEQGPEIPYSDYCSTFKQASMLKHYDIALMILKKCVFNDAVLVNVFPESIISAEAKLLASAIYNACTNKELAIKAMYLQASFSSCEYVQFCLNLVGNIPQRIHMAALSCAEDIEIVKFIALQLDDITTQGGEALEQAAYGDKWEKVFFLIESGVPVDFREEEDDITALMHAAMAPQCKASLDAVKRLLALGADAQKKDYNGHTVIFLAEREGNNEVVSLLLEKSLNKEEDLKAIQAAKKESDLSTGEESDASE